MHRGFVHPTRTAACLLAGFLVAYSVIADDDAHCRFVWITDVLPDDIAGRFSTVMDQAIPIIVRTLEAPA